MSRRTQAERDAAVQAAHEDNIATLADSAEQWGADLSTLPEGTQEAIRLARQARDRRGS